jgi:hypothetical protein
MNDLHILIKPIVVSGSITIVAGDSSLLIDYFSLKERKTELKQRFH